MSENNIYENRRFSDIRNSGGVSHIFKIIVTCGLIGGSAECIRNSEGIPDIRKLLAFEYCSHAYNCREYKNMADDSLSEYWISKDRNFLNESIKYTRAYNDCMGIRFEATPELEPINLEDIFSTAKANKERKNGK